MTVHCPKCSADIDDTYDGADPSVGMMTGGYYCQDCDVSVADWEVSHEPLPDAEPTMCDKCAGTGDMSDEDMNAWNEELEKSESYGK